MSDEEKKSNIRRFPNLKNDIVYTLQSLIEEHGKNLDEVVILASLKDQSGAIVYSSTNDLAFLACTKACLDDMVQEALREIMGDK